MHLDAGVDNAAELLFADEEIHFKTEDVFFLTAVDKAQILRNRAVEDDLADGRVDEAVPDDAVDLGLSADADLRVQGDDAGLVGHERLVDVLESLAFAGLAVLIKGQVVRTQNHILSRNNDRLTVRGL